MLRFHNGSLYREKRKQQLQIKKNQKHKHNVLSKSKQWKNFTTLPVT